jgi:2-keto-4-pentenoate hydratase/2-oxohepta-3-ene-1,7-dioic acid hydratase in catechol pathway
MYLARRGQLGAEIPVVSEDAIEWFDLRSIAADIGADFLSSGLDVARNALVAGTLPVVAPADGEASIRFGSPITGIGKLVCVGLNYWQQVAGGRDQPPGEPAIFLKAPDTVVGPNDPVLIPRGSTATDWEVELGVVVGRLARYVTSQEEAMACVAGYVISNDVSERTFQFERGGQWDKGKNCETFNPLGPWLVTADQVPDSAQLSMQLTVNGEIRQSANTNDMILNVGELICYISQFMVLRPGDVINTGTPAGTAANLPEHPYLREGDVVELEIKGLGSQRQVMESA